MKWFKRIVLVLVFLVVLAFSAFAIWAQFDYGPTEEATSYLGEEMDGDYIYGEGDEEVGFILYQGAKVEPAAYSYIGSRLAGKGHFVVIPQLPFNIALLNSDAGLEIIEQYSEVSTWYLIGHSLGGSAASTIVESNSKIKGIIFLASYPIDAIDVPSLTVYGEIDGVLPVEDIEASRENLRDDAVFHEIKGGNHANFGMYGEQKGDNPSELTPKEQLDETLSVIEEFVWR